MQGDPTISDLLLHVQAQVLSSARRENVLQNENGQFQPLKCTMKGGNILFTNLHACKPETLVLDERRRTIPLLPASQ